MTIGSETLVDVAPVKSDRDDLTCLLDDLAATLGRVPQVSLRDISSGTETDLFDEPSPGIPLFADRSARLQLFGEIARGGMGAILKGHDVDLGRDLAVKVLLDEHRNRPEMVRRFIEEAQIAGQLQHPGIVPVYELGAFADHRPYFAMKLVKGRTLAAVIADRDGSAPDHTGLLVTLLQVAQTVAFAHARGVIHRDLKPSNIMVGAFGEVQVMDWGLAKVLLRDGTNDGRSVAKMNVGETLIATVRSVTDSDQSISGSILGTPSYMAPEQARGEVAAVNERADVFAIGSILCEVLTGEPAFTGRNLGEIVRKAALGDLAETWARLDARPVDAELIALAKDCLSREPEDRPRDASALVERLGGYLSSMEQRMRTAELERAGEAARAEEAKRTVNVAEARARAERQARRLTVALAGSVLVFFALGAGGFLVVQEQRAELARRTFKAQQERSERRIQAARGIDHAINEAERLRDEAKDKPANALALWTEALSSARRANELVQQDDVDPSQREQTQTLLADLEREHATAKALAHQVETERAALSSLEAVRFGRADHPDPKRADVEYNAAFKKAGLDLDNAMTAEAGQWIASRFDPVEFAAYLDDWALVRRNAGRDKADWHRLVEAARAGDPDPWRNTLRTLLDRDDAVSIAELRRLASDSKSLDSQPAASLVLLALQLKYMAKAPKEATAVLEQACRKHADDFWVQYQLATSEAASSGLTGNLFQRLDKAIPHLTAAVALRPRSPLARRILGLALLANNNTDLAVNEFRAGLELTPNNPPLLNALGNALVEQGKIDEAIAAYRQAHTLDPHDRAITYNHRETLWSHGKLDQAITEWRDSLRRDPKRVDLHYDLAWGLWRLGQFEEAVTEFREVVKLDPKHYEAYNFLGNCLGSLGRLEEAVAAHQESIRLNDAFDFSRFCLGSALQVLGRREEAIVQFRKAIEFRPGYDEAHSHLISLLDDLGKRDEIGTLYNQRVEEARRVLERRPLDAHAHNLFAWFLSTHPDPNRRTPDEAIEHARKAVALEPDLGDHRNVLALALYRAAKWKEARKASEEAMEIRKGGNAWDWFIHAMILWQLNEKVDALVWFDKAVQFTQEHGNGNLDLRWFWREAAEMLGRPGPPDSTKSS